jgi:type I restriction enzyme R subunit
VLDALLDKFADEGVVTIEDPNVLRVQPFDDIGTPMEIIRLFGGKQGFLRAVRELEAALYTEAG